MIFNWEENDIKFDKTEKQSKIVQWTFCKFVAICLIQSFLCKQFAPLKFRFNLMCWL